MDSIFNAPDCEFFFPNYQKTEKFNAKDYDPVKMGAKLKLNRSNLAKVSPGFGFLYNVKVKGGVMVEKDPIYIIEDVDIKTFEALLKFIHNGSVVFESVEETIKLVKAALKFQMEDLVNVCVRWLQSIVDTKHMTDITEIAVQLFDKATYIKL